MAFRVDRVDIHEVAMPLLSPWRTSYGRDDAIHSLVVGVTSGDVQAWGEATPFERPEYSAEWAHGGLDLLSSCLAPAVVGREFDAAADVRVTLARYKGNPFAKAALETACWALEAALAGRSLRELLGGRHEAVEVGADFPVMDSFDELVRAIGGAVDHGFRRVKLKFRRGWDLPMLQAVRSDFPDLAIHVDCNNAFSLDDIALLRGLDRFDLVMVEQPLDHDDLHDHAALARMIDTPICLDESITTERRARLAVELGSCRWVNIKPGRVGGLAAAVAIHDLLRDAGVPCWVGGNLESAIGAGIATAFATLDNIGYPADIFPTSRLYPEDLAATEVAFRRIDGVPHAIPDDAGSVREPHPERLDRMSVAAATVTPAGAPTH